METLEDEVPGFPVIAMDERPVQLLKLPAKPGRLARRDYKYHGTACALRMLASGIGASTPHMD